MEALYIAAGITGLFGVGAAGIVTARYRSEKKQCEKLQEELDKLKNLSEEEQLRLAGTKAKEILLEAKDKAFTLQREAEEFVTKQKKELTDLEKKILSREEILEKRSSVLDEKETRLESRLQSVEQAKKDVANIRQELSTKLEELSHLSKEEAKAQLFKQLETELQGELAHRIKLNDDKLKEHSEESAKEILVDAMHRGATEYVSETTLSTVNIPSEDVKGRVIGREGRNIKAFERLTGVDVIVDESPDTISLSSFDPIRREVAIIAMKKLIADGRIHPGKIEEVVQKAKETLAREIVKNGEKLAYDAGVTNLDPKLIKLLGRFKYRASYGQTLDKHTMEVVNICAAIAGEIGANIQLAKKCALFHDIGKVVTHEQEGSHPELGAEIADKFHLEPSVKNAMLAHHELVEPDCIESALVYIGDAISGSRPGARMASVEEYIKRIKSLEDTVKEFREVQEAYAIHAGREVRVIVKPEKINDNQLTLLARDIAQKVQKTQTYPGTVQITVIRENRAIEIAK